MIVPLLGDSCGQESSTRFSSAVGNIFQDGGSTTPGSTWTTNGPYGGPVKFGLAIAPKDTRILYVASSGGVFRTADAGATWSRTSSGIANLTEIHSIAVDPVNPSVVYAGSVNTFDALYKSTDGGAHWTNSSTGLTGGTVDVIAVDPVSSNKVYAGGPLGLWRSFDAAATWTEVNNAPKGAVRMVFDPVSPSTIYAMVARAGIYKSTDSGVTWSVMNTGFAVNFGFLETGGEGLAIDPSVPGRMYAGRYRSTDGGATWTVMPGLGTTINVIVVDPSTPTTVYAGDASTGMYKSIDAGDTWARINAGLANLTIWRLAIDPGTPATVYAATDFGIYKTTDSGANWRASNTGLANTDVLGVAIDPFNPASIYAGTFSNGIFRSADGGRSWVNVFAGTPATTKITGIVADPATPGTFYAANWYGFVLKTRDHGATWTTSVRVGQMISIAIDPISPSTLYVGTVAGGVYKTGNGGATWTAVNNGLPRRPEDSMQVGAIEGIAVSPRDQSIWTFVHTGTEAFTVSISRDGGASWSTAYPGWNPTVSQSGPSLLGFLVNTVGLKSFSTTLQVKQSANPATCVPVLQVVADPFDPTLGFAAGTCGVARARVAGGQLVPVPLPSNTPPWLVANVLAITPTGSDLYAGMQWGGVYRLTLDPAPKVVVEYHLANPDHYFITADPVEQAAVDGGAGGLFLRTGRLFKAGGSTPVCRFFGNTNIDPATGAFYGPSSHFYTASANECASLKAQFTANAKSWKFESNDFLTTPAADGACASGLQPVYRAYNNGFARGIDSNHRITADLAAYQAQVAQGWIGEGVVMCAPR